MSIEQVTQLKTQCESLLEKHEEDIEDWYFEKQDQVISISLQSCGKQLILNSIAGVIRGICL